MTPIDALAQHLSRDYPQWAQAMALARHLRGAPPWLRARVNRALRSGRPFMPLGELLDRLADALVRDEAVCPTSPDWWRVAEGELAVDDNGNPLGEVALRQLEPMRRGGVPAEAVDKFIRPLAAELRASGLRAMEAARVLAIVACVSVETAKHWISSTGRGR